MLQDFRFRDRLQGVTGAALLESRLLEALV